MTRVAVVGAGPVGRATAAYLAMHGHEAGLWSPSGRSTVPLALRARAQGRGRIVVTGALQGEADVAILRDPDEIAACEVVVIAIPADAYAAVLPRVLPALHAGQTVIVSGALSLVPLWIHERAGTPQARPLVAAWGTTLATARRAAGADVEINTLRARFDVAAIPSARIDEAVSTCRTLFGDRFGRADNVLATTLSNINPVAHAAEALPNLTRIERGEEWFLFDCLTPAAARIAEAIDRERLAIARGFGLAVRSIEEHYHLSYHVPRGTVAEIAAAIHARDAAPPGPTTLDHRYILEDMPYGLVFFEALARRVDVPTPVTSAAITFAGAAYGRDFRAANALLADLDLEGLSRDALLRRCNGLPDAV